MKTKWTKDTPTEDGWYWIRYHNKENLYTECPAYVTHLKRANVVHTARNTIFVEGLDHGGWGLKYNGKLDKSIRFGPVITEPN